jgi:two-component system, OmpR family, sensor kinase
VVSVSTATPEAATTTKAEKPRRRPWQSVKAFSDRTPLRIKLIAALLALVFAGLAVAGIIGIFVLRGYLENRADTQVRKLYGDITSSLQPGNVMQGHEAGFLASSGVGNFTEVAQLRTVHGSLVVPNANGNGITTESVPQGMPSFPAGDSWLTANDGNLVTVGSVNSTDTWRVITQRVTVSVQNFITGGFSNETYVLVVGVDLGDINQTIGRLISIDLIVGVIVLICLAGVGAAAVRASLRPLAEMERTASEIAEGDLSRRVHAGDPHTEVGSLGRSLNAMLAHIEAAFRAQAQSETAARRSEERMRQFAADASHELRTPLTAIKGFAEYYRQRGGVGTNGNGQLPREDVDRIMQRVETEASRMGVLVEDLLLLARIDQERPLEHHPVDVLALAADAVQDARMIAPDRDVKLTVGHDTAFLVVGDEARLRQVVGNLMNNALSHTPAGTPVEVHVHSGTLGWQTARNRLGPAGPVGMAGPTTGPPWSPAVVLEVVDHGPGMSAEQAQHVFERFYRADQARTRATGGTGLGLAIVSALVMAHGGTVALDTAPGRGATFRVALPLDPEAQGTDDDDDDDHEHPGVATSPWAPAADDGQVGPMATAWPGAAPPPPPPPPPPTSGKPTRSRQADGSAQADVARPMPDTSDEPEETGTDERDAIPRPASPAPADVVEKRGWKRFS